MDLINSQLFTIPVFQVNLPTKKPYQSSAWVVRRRTYNHVNVWFIPKIWYKFWSIFLAELFLNGLESELGMTISLCILDVSSWESWGEWSKSCSKSCGGGEQSRERSCKQNSIGTNCHGAFSESRKCNEQDCGKHFSFILIQRNVMEVSCELNKNFTEGASGR